MNCYIPLQRNTNLIYYNLTGEWLYVVNIPGDEDHEQGVVTEACL